MADNGMWFKLWIGADEDPDLGNLSLEDFARWCKFGLYIKKYGTDGTVELKEPCLPLQHKFKVTSFQAVLKCISIFPNCTVTYETNAFVTFKNWYKYQGDISTGRVRKFRQRETVKKRRDEMRGDEKRKEDNKNEDPASPAPAAHSLKSVKETAPEKPAAKALDPAIRVVADRIFFSDRKKFARLVVWIKEAQRERFSDTVIAAALCQFERYAATVDPWYPYLDKIIYKLEKDKNARESEEESERYKQELADYAQELKH